MSQILLLWSTKFHQTCKLELELKFCEATSSNNSKSPPSPSSPVCNKADMAKATVCMTTPFLWLARACNLQPWSTQSGKVVVYCGGMNLAENCMILTACIFMYLYRFLYQQPRQVPHQTVIPLANLYSLSTLSPWLQHHSRQPSSSQTQVRPLSAFAAPSKQVLQWTMWMELLH